jgi:hypothetical protein
MTGDEKRIVDWLLASVEKARAGGLDTPAAEPMIQKVPYTDTDVVVGTMLALASAIKEGAHREMVR